jgi:hypothetical protein
MEENVEIEVIPNSLVFEPPEEYCIDMDGIIETECPVENCPYKVIDRHMMRRHFRNIHNNDTIVISEEGRLPRCTECGLFQKNVGLKHQQGADCKRWANVHKTRKKDIENKKTIEETVFTVSGTPIKTVKQFKYLGRILDEDDNDWPAINRNLAKAQAAWGRLGKILSKEKANSKAMASIYKTVIQAVLLYGSESWVLNSDMERKLQSFHRRCARFITGQHIRPNQDGTWTCPSSEEVLSQAGLWTIQEYIQRRKNTVKKFAFSTSAYQTCKTSRPLASNPNQKIWWQNSLPSNFSE